MITKEELLQKGIDSVVADEILARIESDENSSPLEALKKAVDRGSDMETLFKAKKGEGDEEEDEDEDGEEFDEKFMKKHKKYMKIKEHSEPDGDEGMFGKMKKAVDEVDPNSDGAVIQMEDLSPVLNAMVETVEDMTKAISILTKKIEVISSQNSESYNLMAKAAAVTAETAEIVSGIGNAPQGRKGALMADMSKAKPVVVDQKAVWTALTKAFNSGDMKAGEIGSKYESSGKRFNLLNPEEQKYVNELMTKEG